MTEVFRHSSADRQQFELVQYRDGQMRDYTYFWVFNHVAVSPHFNDEWSAETWLINKLAQKEKVEDDSETSEG